MGSLSSPWVPQILQGFSAEAFGYFVHFTVAALLALLSLLLVAFYFPSAPVASGAEASEVDWVPSE